MFRIVVLVSGTGSNLQALIDAIQMNKLNVEIAQVIADREGVYALERAKKAGILTQVIQGDSHYLLETLNRIKPQLIVLAGYLTILPKNIIEAYPHQIINIHPSLLPYYGGKGFYGLRVHEAVIADKKEISGATVHYVEVAVDTGPIILQQEIAVLPEDDPETLQKRVLAVEHKILVKAIKIIARNAA